MKYKHVEHTSDVAFEAYGASLEELFANAALATYSFMTDVEELMKESATAERAVNIQSEDLYSLMFDWLDEILFFFESEMLMFTRFDIKIDDEEFSLSGACKGVFFDPEKHEVGIIVKAVTYHMMEITKKDGRWRARVVLDV